MKLRSLAALLAVLTTMALPALALAQGRDDGHDEHRDAHAAPAPDARRAPPERPHAEPVHEAHEEPRGAGPDHSFRRGGRLPPQYRSNQYVVDDWRAHHLHAPPRGYHWVQTGGDYVLAAVATGVIADILLDH